MEIYLIRHTTPLLRPGLIYGQLEVPLTTEFEAQLVAIKARLPSSFDKIYSSPFGRCTKLAAELARVYETDKRLCELHFGDWEGQTWDSVNQDDLKIWMDDYQHVTIPGGESMQDLRQRVIAFWDDLSKKPFERVAIVTHAGVIRMMLAFHRGIPMDDFFTIEVAYGEVFKIEINSLNKVT